MCHIFWHSVESSAGSAKLCCIGTSCAGSPPRKTFPTDKFSNKFRHFTKQNLFVAQRFLGHNCLGLHRCVRGQRVMLSHSMEISASLTKLFCWLGKSVQPLLSDAITTSMFGFLNAKFQKTKDKLPKATFVAQRFLGHNCLRQHRCVRGQRVVLSQLYWLGKLCIFGKVIFNISCLDSQIINGVLAVSFQGRVFSDLKWTFQHVLSSGSAAWSWWMALWYALNSGRLRPRIPKYLLMG